MAIPMQMVEFQKALEFLGFSVRFHPNVEGRVVVATARGVNNRGPAGNGRLLILDFDIHARTITASYSAVTQSGMCDAAWSNFNNDLAVSGAGDGSVTLWNTLTLKPLRNYFHHEHSDIVRSVDWSPFHKTEILTASSDGTIKLWTVGQSNSLRTFPDSLWGDFSAAAWSPEYPNLFASASRTDGTCRLWDTRHSLSKGDGIQHLRHDVLCCDWSKGNPNIIATTAGDDHLRVWDIRFLNNPPVANFRIYRSFGWNKVRFSPLEKTKLISCSNIEVALWDYSSHLLLGSSYNHGPNTSILGVEMSRQAQQIAASTGEDGRVCIWRYSNFASTL